MVNYRYFDNLQDFGADDFSVVDEFIAAQGEDIHEVNAARREYKLDKFYERAGYNTFERNNEELGSK